MVRQLLAVDAGWPAGDGCSGAGDDVTEVYKCN